MANKGSENPETGDHQPGSDTKSSWKDWASPLLRLLAFCATGAATLVMALNKQTKTFAVATIGNTPIEATITVKFQHTPAFVFFVVANGVASLHNLLMLAAQLLLLARKFHFKGLPLLVLIPVLDMMNVALVSGGVSAAVFMGELARDGNSHTRWNKICDKFSTFCNHGSGAIFASLIGLVLMILINMMTIIYLKRHK